MKISVSYNFPDKGPIEDNTATILIEDISVCNMKRVLLELSEMSVNNFARLGALSMYSDPEYTNAEERNVESFLRHCCSPDTDTE